MTKEEFASKLKLLNGELIELGRQQSEKREEIRKLRAEYCRIMTDEYVQYIGKKVKIEFVCAPLRSTCGITRKTVIGFLTGFSFDHSWGKEFYATVVKVKKDATPSKVMIPFYDMLPWEYMKSIEIIE